MWIINLQKSQAVWVSYLVSGSTEEDNRKTQHRAQPNAVSEFGLAGGKSADGSISDSARSLALGGCCEPASCLCFLSYLQLVSRGLCRNPGAKQRGNWHGAEEYLLKCVLSLVSWGLSDQALRQLIRPGFGPEGLGVYQQGKCA